MGELTAGAVIDRLQKVLGVDADTAVGSHFGHATSTVGGWRKRGHVPYAECVNLAIRKGVSLDWLLLGTGEAYSAGGIREAHAEYTVDPRLARMEGFLRHWFATSADDGKVWLEMQLARAVPEYAEWVAARGRG